MEIFGADSKWAIGIAVTVLVPLVGSLTKILRDRKRKTIWQRADVYPLVRPGFFESIEIRYDGVVEAGGLETPGVAEGRIGYAP